MKAYTLLAVVLVALYLPGCKKEGDDVVKPNPNINGRISTQTTYLEDTTGIHFVDSIVYTYNVNDKLLNYVVYDSLGAPQALAGFQYIDNTVKETHYLGDFITVTGQAVITLNADGYIMHHTGQNYVYFYDTDKHIIRLENGLTNVVQSFTYLYGNLAEHSIKTGADVFKTTFSYDITMPEYRNIGQPYLGKQSISVLKNYTDINGISETYTHLYDLKGRVSRQTTVGNTFLGVKTTYYTYFD